MTYFDTGMCVGFGSQCGAFSMKCPGRCYL